MVSVAYGQGLIQGLGWEVSILLPAIFKIVFDVYNFSITSNLFESDKPNALSTHNRKCARKMLHIWQSTQTQGQKIWTKFAWGLFKKRYK